MVLVLAGLAEGVVVGVKGGAAEVYGAAEYVAGGGVDDLDVDPAVKRYAGTLSDAMGAQISAEDREIEFYALLEEDPALENNREEAENLLKQVGNDYERAEQAYAEARDLADENPNLIEATQ